MSEGKYVIDVNIYVSYILKEKLTELFLFVLDRDFEVFISTALIDELNDVLDRDKFKKYLKTPPLEFVNAVRQFGNLTEPETVKIESPDLKDDYLFLLALSTDSIIVTGDKKLINWQNSPVQVISLAEFKQL
jgi:putative PIN family toxin of toxin-antitoxin system